MIKNGKATILNTPGVLNITIPSMKNWFALLFGTVWLGGWYYGFTNVFSILASSSLNNFGANGFLIFWMLGWTVGGLAVISSLLWGFLGKEQFYSENNEVYLKKTILGLGIKKRMEAQEIKNIKLEVQNGNMFGNNRWAFWGLGPGKIKFNYGFKTYSFGLAVDDAEAEHIVKIMNEHFKL